MERLSSFAVLERTGFTEIEQMATERVTERSDGVTAERTVERQEGTGTTVVERRGGGGAGTLLAVVALVALVAIVAYFLMNANQQEALQTDAVTDAAASVAESASGAAESVSNAAQQAAPQQ
jgi:molybdenum-dependent DNA-binding transcriptional regulator ModE